MSTVRGQPDSRGFPVQGSLASRNLLFNSLMVELVSSTGRTMYKTFLSGDGSFEFPDVLPGRYELRVTDEGELLHKEPVFLSGSYQVLSIRLNSRPPAEHNRGGTVSIRQLQHQVPADAMKEFKRGQQAADKGDSRMALEHFTKAISIDPEFADAYNNLGVTRISLGHLEEAAEAFNRASDLVPDHGLALANLSIALYKLRRYEECATAARRALKLNPGLLNIRFLLALSLSIRTGDEAEALQNLERAAPEIPQAHLLAAQLLVRTGRPEDAAKQLERYLQVSAAEDTQRPTVEQWLAALQKP